MAVRIEVRGQGHVAYVTVNNPERRNVLGIAGKKALAEAFRQLAKDKALRVAVLTGAGERSFIEQIAEAAGMSDEPPPSGDTVNPQRSQLAPSVKGITGPFGT